MGFIQLHKTLRTNFRNRKSIFPGGEKKKRELNSVTELPVSGSVLLPALSLQPPPAAVGDCGKSLMFAECL